MNKWNIPDWLEKEIIERDKCCIYCGVDFTQENLPKKSRPSWEHIINDASIITRENIALCCIGCNASKGTKNLSEWLKSNYCKNNGITEETISDIAKNALKIRKIT